MRRLPPSQFPDPFNRVELRAIGRHELQSKAFPALVPPFSVQAGMMVSDVVQNQHDPAPGMAGEPPELFQKREELIGVEPIYLTAIHELSVPDANGTKVADALPGRMVQQDGVLDLRRNPHPTGRAVLLEPDLIEGPEIHRVVPGQGAQFFYMPPAERDRHGPSSAGACAAGTPTGETAADTAGPPGRCPIAAADTATGSCRPIARTDPRHRGACARRLRGPAAARG